MEHLLAAHKIHTLHFDNVFDLEGFFQRLRVLIRVGEHQWSCPVCVHISSDESEWGRHILEFDHNAWDCTTVPQLQEFVIPAESDLAEEQDEVHQAAVADECDGEDDDDDDEVYPVECPFCGKDELDIFPHVAACHGIPVREIFENAARGGLLRDDYDVIRIVNALRDSSDKSHNCLHCLVSFGTVDDWCAHLQSAPCHLLPVDASKIDDSFLIPRRPNDNLISLLLEYCEDLFQNAEVEPDYPLVPRVVDLGEVEDKVA